MKKIALFFFALAVMSFGSQAYAQEASPDCLKYLDFYTQNYKQKQYDVALPQWRLAYSLCPKNFRANIYIQGSFLLNRQIGKLGNKPANAAYRNALIDSLLTLQDERLQYFPTGKKNGVVVDMTSSILNNKGQYIINFRSANTQYMYDELGAIIKKLGSETKGSIFVNYMQAAIQLYRDGKISIEDVMSAYTNSSELLSAAVPADDAEAQAIGEAKTTLESVFAESNVASCDNLVAIFAPRYNANPDDVTTISNIVKLMSKAECFSSDLYLKAVTAMHKLDPSASSAYFLYKLHSSRNNVSDAVKYMNEAIAKSAEAAPSSAILAQYYYELANFAYKNNLKKEAYSAAQSAASLDFGYAGKAYMLMGHIWASTSYAGNEITRYAPRWAACDFYNKAKAVDASLTEEANRQLAKNMYYAPLADAFMYDYKNGQSITITAGGMTVTTTMRLK